MGISGVHVFFLFLGGVAELVENTTFPIYFSYLSTVLIG